MKTNSKILVVGVFILCLCMFLSGCKDAGSLPEENTVEVSSGPNMEFSDKKEDISSEEASATEDETSEPIDDIGESTAPEELKEENLFDEVPLLCDEIIEKLSSHGWKNITVTHGPIDTAKWGVWVDTTYGAEELHIYTITGDDKDSPEECDFHAISSVIYDEETNEWVEQPIIYLREGVTVIDRNYLMQSVGIDPYYSHEYADYTEYLYADDTFLDWFAAGY